MIPYTLELFGINTILIIITVTSGCFTFFKWRFNHWKRKGVPYAKPRFPFGTLENPYFATKSLGAQYQYYYNKFKKMGYLHAGFFHFSTPVYMPIDVKLIKDIMVKHFAHFVDRGFYYDKEVDPLSSNLFFLNGSEWKHLRTKLTPTFTTGKMKMMVPLLEKCANYLKDAVAVTLERNDPINVKTIAGCFTVNVTMSCAFGLECNCFNGNNLDFEKYAKLVFNSGPVGALKDIISTTSPALAAFLRLSLIPKESSCFFLKVIEEIVHYRENNNIVRQDFLQLLINIKNTVRDRDGKGIGFTTEEIAAQAFIFFIAGYETSSSVMTFCLFELATNQIIQEKVRDDVRRALNKNRNQLSYETLSDMKYVGQVVDETLRKHSPATFLQRKCTKSYNIPNTNIVLEKGTRVMIPLSGLQNDLEYFPNPERFDPERFSDENKNRIPPFTYMPFGEGPRICIAFRFALLQIKVGLATLLKSYKFTLNDRTITPLRFDPFSFGLAVKDNIWLNAEKL